MNYFPSWLRKWFWAGLWMVLFSSCRTIEKRRYSDGFYFSRTSKFPVGVTSDTLVDRTLQASNTTFSDSQVQLLEVAPLQSIRMETGVNEAVEFTAGPDTLPPPQKEKRPGNFKDDSELDVTKKERRVEVFSLVGFVLTFFAYSLLYFTPMVALLPVTLVAFLCCAFGIYRARKKEGELNYPIGRALGIIGAIASGLILFAYAIVSLRGI